MEYSTKKLLPEFSHIANKLARQPYNRFTCPIRSRSIADNFIQKSRNLLANHTPLFLPLVIPVSLALKQGITPALSLNYCYPFFISQFFTSVM